MDPGLVQNCIHGLYGRKLLGPQYANRVVQRTVYIGINHRQAAPENIRVPVRYVRTIAYAAWSGRFFFRESATSSKASNPNQSSSSIVPNTALAQIARVGEMEAIERFA
jgi:hypothetical protein